MSLRRTLLIPFVALAFAACGDDGATSDTDIVPTPGVQQGTAAIGAPIVGAEVDGVCADGSTPSGTTEDDGRFALDVDDAALPCVLTLTGGTARGSANTTTLHSFATDAGIVNITPLTGLALAKATNAVAAQSLTTWAATPTDFDAVADALAASTDALRQSLATAGFGLPAAWVTGSLAPFTTPFATNPASDPFDALLEDLAGAFAEASVSYADALASFVAGDPLPAAVIDPTDLPLTGDGAALADGDGATGSINGTTYTHASGLVWGYVPQFGSDTGSFRVYGASPGGFDALTGWLISGFKAEVGTYSCKARENDTTRIQLLLGGGAFYDTAPAGGACRIEIVSISQTSVTGRFSAVFVNGATGEIAGTVTDGYFHKKVFDGGGEPLPEGEVGMSFEMDGQTWRYASAASLAFEGFSGMTSAPPSGPGFPLGIQLHSVPSAVGTYECDTDPDSYRQLNIWFTWNFAYYLAGVRASTGTGPPGSRCKVTVTKTGSYSTGTGTYNGTFEGTFEGTFVSVNPPGTKVVTDGKFRYIGQP